MVINLTRTTRCVRCKRRDRGRLRAAMVIHPVPWLGFKFRVCRACADDMVERAEASPNIRRVE